MYQPCKKDIFFCSNFSLRKKLRGHFYLWIIHGIGGKDMEERNLAVVKALPEHDVVTVSPVDVHVDLSNVWRVKSR